MPTRAQLEARIGTTDLHTGGGGIVAPKSTKKGARETGRPDEMFPHFTPAVAGGTPDHYTDIRKVRAEGEFMVFQRFHQHVGGDGEPGDRLHDRFIAVHQRTREIHAVGALPPIGAAGGVPQAQARLADEPRTHLRFNVTAAGSGAIMSRRGYHRANKG